MKWALFILLVFIRTVALSQSGKIHAVVVNPDSNIYKEPALVELTLDSHSVYSGYREINRPFTFERLAPGRYKLGVRQIGKRTEYYDSLRYEIFL